MKIQFQTAQRFVAEEMQGVPRDMWSDELDRLAVVLMDDHGASDQEADDVIGSDWWRSLLVI